MDWTVYWFMLPACVVIASVAMFSGISGAALLMPVFLIAFPLLDVPTFGTVAAVGLSLFLETSGFGTGVYRYLRRGLVDTQTAKQLVIITLPAGILGAVAAHWVPVDALRTGYGVAMLALAVVLFWEKEGDVGHGAHRLHEDDASAQVDPQRLVRTRDGETFRYRPAGLGGQRALSGAGAVVAGLISTGVGEATLPGLVRRSGFPVPVAAATSTVVVASTVAGAALTHLVQLARVDGFSAIPWNLILWAVPGAVIGAWIGTFLQGRIPQRASRLFFGGLFAAIGLVFLIAFTGLTDIAA